MKIFTQAAACMLWISVRALAVEAPPPPAPPTPPAAPPILLYVRLGGLGKLADVGERLAPLLAADETLKANEALKPALAGLSQPELRYHVTAVLCQLSGGPERYTGAPIPELMRRLKLGDKEAGAALADLKKALDEAKAPAAEAQELSTAADDIWKQLVNLDERTVRDKERGFSITLPAGWQRQDAVGVALFAQAPTKDPRDAKAHFQDNINVIAEELPVEMTSTEFSKAMLLIASRQLKEFKSIETAPLKINGEAAEYALYAHKNTGAPVRVASYFIVRGKRAYTINCVASEENFQAELNVFAEAVKSFRLE